MKQDKLNKIIGAQPDQRIPHDFQLQSWKSQEKGKMFKGKSGIFQVANESKYFYRCVRCDSEIELPNKLELKSLNIQVALKFSCRP